MRALTFAAGALALLKACNVTEDEVRMASEAGVAAVEAEERREEIERATDYDAIAAEAVSDVDTTGFDALIE